MIKIILLRHFTSITSFYIQLLCYYLSILKPMNDIKVVLNLYGGLLILNNTTLLCNL